MVFQRILSVLSRRLYSALALPLLFFPNSAAAEHHDSVGEVHRAIALVTGGEGAACAEESKDFSACESAMGLLSLWLESHDEFLPDVVELTSHGSRKMRELAVLAISHSNARDSSTTAALIRALDDESPEVRGAAAYALGKRDLRADDSWPSLQRNLLAASPELRLYSAFALKRLFPDRVGPELALSQVASEGFSTLLRIIHERDVRQEQRVRRIAQSIGGTDRDTAVRTIPKLTALATEPEPWGLAGFGRYSKFATPEGAGDDTIFIKYHYAETALVGYGEMIPELVDLLLDPSHQKEFGDRSQALRALGLIGVADSRVITYLSQQLLVGEEAEQFAAARALGALGQKARPALESLLLALRSGNEEIRWAVGTAIVAIDAPFFDEHYEEIDRVDSDLAQSLKLRRLVTNLD